MQCVVRVERPEAHRAVQSHVDNVVKLVQRVIPIARRFLDFTPNVEVVLRTTEAANAYYAHMSTHGRVVIDPNKCHTLKLTLSALLHELVHAEQFHQGRLSNSGRHMTLLWMGEPFVMIIDDYEKYRAQPWEVEAFEREKILITAVLDEMKKTNESVINVS